MSKVWLFLNNNAGAVQAVSTAVLVIITAIYVSRVGKTNKLMGETNELMSMQIFPKIFIVPDKLCSFLLNPEQTAKIKAEISETTKNLPIVPFLLDYKIMNHSASSGSVDRPQLLIENPVSGKRKVLQPDIRSVVEDISLKGEVKNTIYLKAGEMKSMREEFHLYARSSDKLSDDEVDLINNAPILQYTILYKNVVGQQFSEKLTKEQVLPPKN